MYHLHKDEMVCNAVQALSPGPNTIKDPIRIPMVLRFADTSVTIQYH